MRNLILSALSAGLLFATAPASPASAAVAADINLHFGQTPRYYFARQPRTILIPDSPVYYVSGLDNYDMFQCDGWWYIDDGGYWYRAPSYRGPFVSVSFQSVPDVILNVPSAYAHQPYRPGMWRSDSRSYGGNYGGGNVYYRGGNRGSYGGNDRWQDRRNSDQRWQDRQRNDRSWNRDRGDDRNQGGWNNGNNGRGHGNGNGHGRGNGNGHGRGRGNDGDDD